ncbi:hypothetical protein WDV93_10280 [Pantoea ananatis]
MATAGWLLTAPAGSSSLYYLLNRANVFGGNWLGAAQFAVGQLLDDDALAAGQAKPA